MKTSPISTRTLEHRLDSGFGALVLAGGASKQMGAAKAEADWLGIRVVDRVAALAAAAGPSLIPCVGARS
jgi:molybdopterin-guanine dinucleotide biosynthesis protein A